MVTELPTARERAEALREKGRELLDAGEFAAALSAYDDSLGCARETADPAFVDWIFACRAAAAAEAGSAEDELLELKRILLRTSDAQTAFRAAYTSARVYELRRDTKKALFYNRLARQRAEQIEEQLDDASLRGAAENQLGDLLMVDSRFEEAAASFERALELAASPMHRAIVKDNLGYCWLALDRNSDGLAIVHEAFDYLEAQGATALTVYPLLDLCFGYLKADRYAEARYFGEAGLARVEETEELAVEKNFLYLLGETCHLSGDAGSAQDYFDRLAALYPEFRNLRAYLEVFDFRNVINLRA